MQDKGSAIAERALAQVDTKFMLHGRVPGVALDCVGLVATSIADDLVKDTLIPAYYSLRGEFQDIVADFFAQQNCLEITNAGPTRPGDILLVRIDPRQLHFLVCVQAGYVHAHAGLRKIVLTPDPLPWPIIGHWRIQGV